MNLWPFTRRLTPSSAASIMAQHGNRIRREAARELVLARTRQICAEIGKRVPEAIQ